MTPEGAVIKACLEYLEIKGIFAWRNNSGALWDKNNRLVRFGKKGSADILGILPDGIFLAVECKGGHNKPTDDQKMFLENIEKNGGCVILARSVEDLEKGLQQFYSLQSSSMAEQGIPHPFFPQHAGSIPASANRQ